MGRDELGRRPAPVYVLSLTGLAAALRKPPTATRGAKVASKDAPNGDSVSSAVARAKDNKHTGSAQMGLRLQG